MVFWNYNIISHNLIVFCSLPHPFILLCSGEDLSLTDEDVTKGPAAASLLVETGNWTYSERLYQQGLWVGEGGLLWHHATHITYVPAWTQGHIFIVLSYAHIIMLNINYSLIKLVTLISNIEGWTKRKDQRLHYVLLSLLRGANLRCEGQRPEPVFLALSSCMAGTGWLKRWQKQNMAQTKTPEVARPSWKQTK